MNFRQKVPKGESDGHQTNQKLVEGGPVHGTVLMISESLSPRRGLQVTRSFFGLYFSRAGTTTALAAVFMEKNL